MRMLLLWLLLNRNDCTWSCPILSRVRPRRLRNFRVMSTQLFKHFLVSIITWPSKSFIPNRWTQIEERPCPSCACNGKTKKEIHSLSKYCTYTYSVEHKSPKKRDETEEAVPNEKDEAASNEKEKAVSNACSSCMLVSTLSSCQLLPQLKIE